MPPPSTSSATARTTIEISFPSTKSDFYCRITTGGGTSPSQPTRPQAPARPAQPRRCYTEPQRPAIAMARDSLDNRSSYCTSRRGSAYSTSQPSSSLSQAKTVSTNASSRYYNDTASVSAATTRSSTSVSASSNITGFRCSLDVAGSPPAHYFTSGDSKRDRRPEYIGMNPLSSSYADSRMGGQGSSYFSGSVRGREMVRYHSYAGPGRVMEQPEDEEYDDDDDATILPSDSISNVSYDDRSDRSWRSKQRYEQKLLFGEAPPPQRSAARTVVRSYTYAGDPSWQVRGRRGNRRGQVETVTRVPEGY